jgi:hypothetical protein
MGITTVTSREFDRHTRRVFEAVKLGPVFITRYGRLAYVLITFEEYRKIPGAELPEARIEKPER